MKDIITQILKPIQSLPKIKRTNIRIYAVKSDDDPKTRNPNLPKTKKTNVRVYAVKSDDDPKPRI